MIKDFLISFRDNIKEKTTNPFLGTLIIVWFLHNYRNIFLLFFYDNGKDKLSILDEIFHYKFFLPNLICCVLISIIVLAVTYFFLNVARLIINFFEKTVTPFIYKITDSSSTVLKTEYNTLLEQKERVQQKLDDEKKKRINLEEELEKLTIKTNSNIANNDIFDHYKEQIEERGFLDIFENLIYDIENGNVELPLDNNINEAYKFFSTLKIINLEFNLIEFTDKGIDFKEYYKRKYLNIK